MSDFDAEINSLEGPSTTVQSVSPRKYIWSIAAGLVSGSFLTFLIKPSWVYSHELDQTTDKVVARIKWVRLLMSIILFGIVTVLALRQYLL